MGEDKAFLKIGDPPQLLWERQVDLLTSLEPNQVLLSHNAEQTFQVPEGVELIEDIEDDRGPLGGVVSCLRQSNNSRLLVLAVDLPFMTAEFLVELLDGGGGVVLRDEERHRYEAVVAVYTAECLAIAEERLEKNELAMQGFISECVEAGLLSQRPITAAQLPVLKNWNRPEDLN